MEQSVLKSTKKILGLAEDYTAFDLDVITLINSAFSNLNQLGVGPGDMTVSPTASMSIEDDETVWNDFGFSPQLTNMIKTYVFLKVKHMFDPPLTGFHSDATERQIAEHEWRISNFREELIPVPVVTPPILPEEAFWWWEQG